MSTFQFVADISAAPALRLNINDGTNYAVDVRRVVLDPPKYDQVWSTNPMSGGGRLIKSQPTNRLLVIPVHVVPTTAQGQAVAIENLTRELARNNYLKVQFANTNPLYFRTFMDPEIGSKIRRQLQDSSTITLQIVAEPWGIGPRVEVPGSPFTVSNNPAAGTNPCHFDITGVLGDAPTPLLLQATSTGSTNGLVSKWSHFATRRRGIPGNYSNVIQAESMTNGTDTADVVDGAFSNGNKVRVTFVTTTLALRVSHTFPGDGVPNVEARGLYRAYVRIQKVGNATDGMTVQLRYGMSSTDNIANKEITMPTTTNGAIWMDLGLVPVPAYSDPIELGYSGVRTKALLTWFGIYVSRFAGGGNIDIDCVYFMPADEPTSLIAKFPTTDTTYVVDGTTEAGGAVYAMNTALDEILNTAGPAQIVAGGGFPELIPGATNRIHMLRQVSLVPTSADGITNTTTIRAYYWPRWRQVARP